MAYILCSMFRWCRRLWYSCCSVMLGLSHNFQQYLNYILWVSCISGGNRSALWKSSTFFKSLTKIILWHNVIWNIYCPVRESNSQS